MHYKICIAHAPHWHAGKLVRKGWRNFVGMPWPTLGMAELVATAQSLNTHMPSIVEIWEIDDEGFGVVVRSYPGRL